MSKLKYKEWVEFLQNLSEKCQEKEIELLIIDTLTAFWSVDDENDASKVQSALMPLNYFIKKNMAILLVHHFSKSGGANGTASRGSGALPSFVDVIIEFSRLDGDNQNSTQRQLKTLSRFKDTPTDIVIQLIEGAYKTLGTKAEVNKSGRLDKYFKLVKQYPEGVSTKTLHENWDDDEFGKRPSERTIRRYFSQLVALDKIKLSKVIDIKGGKLPIYQAQDEAIKSREITPDRTVDGHIEEQQPLGITSGAVPEKCGACGTEKTWLEDQNRYLCLNCHPR